MTDHPFGRTLIIDTNLSSTEIERVLKGLASDKRLAILRFLAGRSCSVSEIAEAMNMPLSTTTMHLNVLEESGLVKTELKPASRGLQKVCARLYDQIVLTLPSSERTTENNLDITMPIGAYTDCDPQPTCGLASEYGIIGELDHPDTFYDPERVNTQLLWFKQGYVEYRFPNRLPHGAILESLQFSLEISSEAPLHNAQWPSDITMWVNGVEVGTWTSPGDFGGDRGALTPDWWEEWNSQYGLLKMWRVTDHATYVDGVKVSTIDLSKLNIGSRGYIAMRIGIKENAANIGGLNIFGRCFGNYPQDIVMRMRFRQANELT